MEAKDALALAEAERGRSVALRARSTALRQDAQDLCLLARAAARPQSNLRFTELSEEAALFRAWSRH